MKDEAVLATTSCVHVTEADTPSFEIPNRVPMIQASRAAFLRHLEGRVPKSLASVQFGAILDRLIEWSERPDLALTPRAPGKQSTVSFGLHDGEPVLWSVYPRNVDGAKIVVLPGLFDQMPEKTRKELVRRIADVSGSSPTAPEASLQLPLHLLATDRALGSFLGVLHFAYESALHYTESRARMRRNKG